ncbi:membrane protein DedA with SNARE-associated domain [Polymorphobacter multimanifer]|uniref:Membrane protein DedA with SNARE-associated domain n=2 Tax=Polymorphobacter multimanifer TaxID=1070431 RepID=A0A841L5J7_9SPHN|nr:DedA family protein [Polymorphobacter multimanifer]MBB6227874.1 membrane protein DedA with SNARE-associated domain [Polymorphobacter multimanifer]
MFDRILEFLGEAGYLGIALLMFLENVFPPIPSELIVPSAGYSAGQGRLNLAGVIAAATLGSVTGALFWYFVGKWIGDDRLKAWAARHGRWLTLRPRDVERVDRWFDAHSGSAVFFGRLVPAVRTLISVPAGIFGMGLGRFLLFSTLGSALWTTLLAVAGYQLQGQHALVGEWLNPVATLVIGAMVVWYVWRVASWRAE